MEEFRSEQVRVWQDTTETGCALVGLENERVRVGLLPEKGADMFELTYRSPGVDVLWKSPWGPPSPYDLMGAPSDSQGAWLEIYPGGWQTIFPNAGPACESRGASLGFHGEASVRPWQWEIRKARGGPPELSFTVRLRRTPFYLERRVVLDPHRPVLTIRERIENRGGVEMPYVWGHHPALGAPFLEEGCLVDVGAKILEADDEYASPHSPLEPGERVRWNDEEGRRDLGRVPALDGRRDLFAYFKELDEGWWAVTNPELGFGVGMRWPREIFPYAWFWQEINATDSFPWYGDTRVMAIEPFSGFPGQGLDAIMEKTGTERYLAPGEDIEAEIQVIFYEGKEGVERIGPDGEVARSGDGAA